MGPGLPWELKDHPRTEPGIHEILVKVLACTLCGSDLHSIHGRREVPVPSVLGHEIVGEIEAFGPDAPNADLQGEPLAVGDRVVWGIVANCDSCFYCLRDLPQKCERGFKYGHRSLDAERGGLGGLAQHCLLVAGTKIAKLPSAMPLEAACPLGCATSTIAAAFRILRIQPGETILIAGAGMLGLTACAMANRLGVQHILCVEQSAARRQLAMEFGATLAIDAESLPEAARQATAGHGVDAAIDCTGNNAVSLAALQSLRMGGRIGLVGAVFPTEPVPVVLEQLVRRQIAIHGIHNYASHDLLRAVAFMKDAERVFPFSQLVTRWYSLDQIELAVEAAMAPNNIRVGVLPQPAR